MKLIGIDYGSKRVGVALSDDEGKIAFPNQILDNDKKLLDKLGNIIKENSVGEIVVGESLDYKGKENEIMSDVKQFASKLSIQTGCPINYESEVLSSREARNFLGKKYYGPC